MWCIGRCISCVQGCDKCSGSGDYKVCDQKVVHREVHKLCARMWCIGKCISCVQGCGAQGSA
jgi:hypothetical protein